MKVLFLDIDGVVNCRSTPQTDGWPIDAHMAFLVARICEWSGCKVVLSSSWRHSEEGQEIVRKRVMPFIDMTPDNNGTTSRGSEINEWLKAHPDVTQYAILDDNNDMLEKQKPNFFKTSFEFGLTEEIAQAVIKHFNGYPLLAGAPDHFSDSFLVYLRKNNPVVFEDDHWLVIENCKYHTPERPWLTAFAKVLPIKDVDFSSLLLEFGDMEWKKKAADKQSVQRFHVHIFKPV